LLAVAESLEIVDEATWKAAFPDFVEQSPLVEVSNDDPLQTMTTDAPVPVPVAATGPLFLIPDGLPEYEPLSAGIATGGPVIDAEDLRHSALVGIRDGDSFDHLSNVTITTEPFAPVTEAIDLPNGPARIERDQDVVRVSQQRDGKWIGVRVSLDRELDAIDLLQSIRLDSEGNLDLANSGYEIVIQTAPDVPPSAPYSVYADLVRIGTVKSVTIGASSHTTIADPRLC
jgi:hypothetical protein